MHKIKMTLVPKCVIDLVHLFL